MRWRTAWAVELRGGGGRPTSTRQAQTNTALWNGRVPASFVSAGRSSQGRKLARICVLHALPVRATQSFGGRLANRPAACRRKYWPLRRLQSRPRSPIGSRDAAQETPCFPACSGFLAFQRPAISCTLRHSSAVFFCHVFCQTRVVVSPRNAPDTPSTAVCKCTPDDAVETSFAGRRPQEPSCHALQQTSRDSESLQSDTV